MNEVPNVSLAQHGLRIREGLQCPAGGPHHINDKLVIAAAALVAQGGEGQGRCLKCGETLHFEAA